MTIMNWRVVFWAQLVITAIGCLYALAPELENFEVVRSEVVPESYQGLDFLLNAGLVAPAGLLLFFVWLGFAGAYLPSPYRRFLRIGLIAFPLMILALGPIYGVVANSHSIYNGNLPLFQWINNYVRFVHFSLLSGLAICSVMGTALLFSIKEYAKS